MSEEKTLAEHRWRLLAHAAAGTITVEDEGVFDELTVDDWLHVKHMTEGKWWMRIGDARVQVNVDAEGRAGVDIERGKYGPARGKSTVYREPEAVQVRQLERLVALVTIGITVAVEQKVFTTEEATHFLFLPFTAGVLSKLGARKPVVDMVRTSTEIEDIEDIVPHALGAALTDLRKEALACLEGVGEYDFRAAKWLEMLVDSLER